MEPPFFFAAVAGVGVEWLGAPFRPDAVAQSRKEQILSALEQREPSQWGTHLDGVTSTFDTDEREVALTFDACNSFYDEELIRYLEIEEIPATLFLAGEWIDAHPDEAGRLADSPLFEIGNHGLEHRPCSVSGESAWGIKGSDSVREAHREIEANAEKIEEITGQSPRFYRSGTGYYDEVCVELARELGYIVAGFDVAGDQGAMFSAEQIEAALLEAGSGSIILMHMNAPDSAILDGLQRALPRLEEKGYRFVRLSERLY